MLTGLRYCEYDFNLPNTLDFLPVTLHYRFTSCKRLAARMKRAFKHVADSPSKGIVSSLKCQNNHSHYSDVWIDSHCDVISIISKQTLQHWMPGGIPPHNCSFRSPTSCVLP